MTSFFCMTLLTMSNFKSDEYWLSNFSDQSKLKQKNFKNIQRPFPRTQLDVAV